MRHASPDTTGPRPRPPRAILALAALAAALAPASCGRLVVLAADPWWGAVTAAAAAPARGVAVAALRAGRLPVFLAVGEREDAFDLLEARLARSPRAAVVIGPPFASDTAALAARHPAATFVLVGTRPADDGIANTVQLVFDRTAAFREAGRLAGSRGPVAVLDAPGRPAEETAAFAEGATAAAGSAPIARVLPDRPEAGTVQAAVAELRAGGVAVFLYRPTGSAAAFLDALAAAGGVAVVEDWAASRPRPAQVLASVEDDLSAGIAACLARGAPPVVTVPGRLVPGGAPPGGGGAGDGSGAE